MSDTLADLASWLPSDFLSDDHFLNNHNPHLFPHDFASTSSTESESDDDDISGVTRRFTRSVSLQDRVYPFQKKRVFSGSPESAFNNSTITVPTKRFSFSSPTTPFAHTDEHSWDLIYAAAGEVARMKMRMNHANDIVFANRGLLRPQHHPGPPPLSHHHQHHHHQNCAMWCENEEFFRQQQFRRTLAGGRRPAVFRQSPWPHLPVENHRRQQLVMAKPVVAGSGAVVKKECAGTGVFLPRRYNDPSEMKKKPVHIACSPAQLPARVAQSFTKNMDPIMALPQPTGFPPHYEIAMARRNAAMLAQQRRSVIPEPPEVVLPQEWTY